MQYKKKLEICVFTLESAIIAEKAGADRIELCENNSEGGTTPSYGTVLLSKKLLNIPIHVMIRPRGGNFIYSSSEFEAMIEDVKICKKIGVNGVVFGILNNKYKIDKQRCAELVDLAKPLSTTFHKAFDFVEDPFDALKDLIDCKFNRILTSGLQATAINGAFLISELIKEANAKIIIMPGGGIRANNLSDLLVKTKAIEFHSSAISDSKDNTNYNLNKNNEKLFVHSNALDSGIDSVEIIKMKQILEDLY